MKAKEIIHTLPDRLNQEKIKDEDSSIFHFLLEGDNGGEFTVRLNQRVVETLEILEGEPSCVVETSAKVFEDIQLGRTKAELAFFMGKIKISDLGEMLKFLTVFHKLQSE